MGWIYLICASIFEVGWVFSLKFLSFKKIAAIKWGLFFQNNEGIFTLLPLLAYIVLGLGNIYLFSMATKLIPTSIAFAIWMSLTLVGVKLIELFIYKQSLTLRETIFITMIVVGIIGLKKAS